jgi:two-component system, NtrC family, nitrogen regulation response regulator NtrX
MFNASENILVVDDDKTLRELLFDILTFEKYSVKLAKDGFEAIEIAKYGRVDLVFLDLLLPGIDGIETLKELLTISSDMIIIMISGYGTIPKALEATKIGAYDFLEKPLDAQRILLTVRNALEVSKLKKNKISIKESLAKYKMIGLSRTMQQIFCLIDTISPTNTRVLITGESGTGKELVASAIHENSKRSQNPFIRVNCAAIPESLIESELFGFEKGSFTDAKASKNGFFQQANGGTLFLDEIGDLSLQAQAKVLTALEVGEVVRIGGQAFERVDVRVISATNKNLEELCTHKKFREDLFHRINVLPMHLVPLRERIEDIVPLARHFLQDACQQNELKAKILQSNVEPILYSMKLSGNARELRNIMERTAILANTDLIDARTLNSVLNLPENLFFNHKKKNFREAREAFERSYILSCLEENNWNISQAAQELQIERTHLYRKMEKLKIEKLL